MRHSREVSVDERDTEAHPTALSHRGEDFGPEEGVVCRRREESRRMDDGNRAVIVETGTLHKLLTPCRYLCVEESLFSATLWGEEYCDGGATALRSPVVYVFP